MIDFLVVSAAVVAACVLAMLVTAYVARRAGRISVVEITWGVALAFVALVCALIGDGDPLRRWLLAAAVSAWGLRLSWHIWRRGSDHHDGDPRYTELLGGRGGPVLRVWIPQGGAIWFVSLPVQVSAVAGSGVGAVLWAGIGIWLVGIGFESVGDAQLAAYRKAASTSNADRPLVMDGGLWRYTRHPNYFGDACVWWGIWLVSASAWPGVLSVPSPIVMTYFLIYATGAVPLEQRMMKRPGYPEYAARTSMFVPLPPKR